LKNHLVNKFNLHDFSVRVVKFSDGHEAIYDSHRVNNEEASAQLAGSILRPLGVPEERMIDVIDVIDVSRHVPQAIKQLPFLPSIESAYEQG